MGKEIIWSKNALEQLEHIHFYIFFESKSIHIADKIVILNYQEFDNFQKK